MRIALTGAAGFTGAYVQQAFLRKGIECVSLAADLTDAAAVKTEVEQSVFDGLIHLAAEAFPASEDWRRFYAVNQIGTLTLLEAVAARRPGTRCILASSAQIYGPKASGRISEDFTPQPSNHYAVSKLAMEQGSRLFAGQLEIVAARPFNYTGVGQEARYVIPKIVACFRRKGATLELGNMAVRREFGDVRSVADAYVGLALAKAPPPVVNIGTGIAHSIREIVALAAQITGHQPVVEINPDFVRPNDVPVLFGDPRRLIETLPDWRPRGIEETLAWMLAAS